MIATNLRSKSVDIEIVCRKYNRKKSELNDRDFNKREKEDILNTYLTLLCFQYSVKRETILNIINN